MKRAAPLYRLVWVTCPACGHRTRKSLSWFLAGTRRHTCLACEREVPLLRDAEPKPPEAKD